ncbi:hypothetical protein FLGE108171_07175 [Flavobacterium gelidilacus]|uniref:hypothetical protein n=1 Tax=Flavobacterium gelidilacus TaxID=206041 RepID=UPI0004130B85|nr:hypothetical protein [Flavobacterium gelidilacus]
MTLKNIDHSVILNNESTFCIANREDKIGTVRNLSQFLENEGIHVVPFENAKNAIENRLNYANNVVEKDIEKAFNIKNINSVYSIVLDYDYQKDFIDLKYKRFRYSIVDLNTGNPIIWGFSYSNDMETTSKTLKILAKKIKKRMTN